MELRGIDSDEESWDERSDYTLARRYADYEIHGKASAQEMAWLHAHPLLWLRALKMINLDVRQHNVRSRSALSADPRKPVGPATAEKHVRWAEITAEAKKLYVARQTFLIKVRERIAVVRALVPSDRLALEHLNTLLFALLDIETRILSEPEQARRQLGWIILRLSKVIDVRSEKDQGQGAEGS